MIRYHYLFTPSRGNYPKIALMLRSLVAIPTLRPTQYGTHMSWSEDKKKEYLAEHEQEVVPAIERLRRHLYISFTTKLRFDEFCIHSADDSTRRRGFLKIGQGYAPMWRETVNKRAQEYKIGDNELTESVFAPGELKGEARQWFEHYIRDVFPENWNQQVVEICFGPEAAS